MNPIPEEIRRFIVAQIGSIEQLEILRVLGDDPTKEWRAADLVHVVQASPQTIESQLAALQAKGLLTVLSHGTIPHYRYGARTPELESNLSQLLALYRERPVTMIRLVYDSARDELGKFSDAFRIRKEN